MRAGHPPFQMLDGPAVRDLVAQQPAEEFGKARCQLLAASQCRERAGVDLGIDDLFVAQPRHRIAAEIDRRCFNVARRRQVGQQVVTLEDEAEMLAPQLGQGVGVLGEHGDHRLQVGQPAGRGPVARQQPPVGKAPRYGRDL